MHIAQKLALAYLVALVLIVYGYCISHYQIFPYQLIAELEAFIKDEAGSKDLSVSQKIENDLNIEPFRQIVEFEGNAERPYTEVAIPSVKPRRDTALVYRTEQATPGYRLLFGTIDFVDGLHGAVLLDDTDTVRNTWVITEDDLDFQIHSETNIASHDLELLEDGSIIFSYMFGNSMQRIDWCGERIWVNEGDYHHNFSRSDEGTLWTLKAIDGSQHLVQLDEENGAVLQKISMHEIVEANPEIDIFGLRQRDSEDSFTWLWDYWHENDVDVLNSDLASSFEGFSAGDLLLSFRNINLIAVVEPATLRIKWWRVGLSRRPHDPDWLPDGTISIYDNNTHREFSRIVNVDPQSFESRISYSGEADNFYSWRKGNHQVLDNGHILIASTEQGRVLEVDVNGNTVYEFINRYDPASNRNLVISDIVHVPTDYLDIDAMPGCAQ